MAIKPHEGIKLINYLKSKSQENIYYLEITETLQRKISNEELIAFCAKQLLNALNNKKIYFNILNKHLNLINDAIEWCKEENDVISAETINLLHNIKTGYEKYLTDETLDATEDFKISLKIFFDKIAEYFPLEDNHIEENKTSDSNKLQNCINELTEKLKELTKRQQGLEKELDKVTKSLEKSQASLTKLKEKDKKNQTTNKELTKENRELIKSTKSLEKEIDNLTKNLELLKLSNESFEVIKKELEERI